MLTIVIFIAAFDIDKFKSIKEYQTRWKIFEEKLKIPLTNVFELDIIELSKAERYIGKNGIPKNIGLDNWLKFLINPMNMEESEMEDVNKEIKKAYEIWKNLQDDDEAKDAAERRFRELASNEAAKKYEYKLGKLEVAQKLLEMGMDIKDVMKCTGLTKKELTEMSIEK